MSSDAALTRLAQSSSEAVVGILEMFAPGKVEAGDVAVLEPGSNRSRASPSRPSRPSSPTWTA